MDNLPAEILEKIFSALSKPDMLSVALTSQHFHSIALTLLYRRIQEIQLFGWDEHAHLPSIRCLQTLATPGSKPQAVRHFTIRGLPWIQETTMGTLSRTFVNMIGLLSLDLDMGAFPETKLLSESLCASSSFLPQLNAISLHDHLKAAALITGRSVEFLRLRTAIEAPALSELLTGLKAGAIPLRSLQVWVSVPNLAVAVTVMANISCNIPSLETFGITFTFPNPYWTEGLHDAVEEIAEPLVGLKELVELGIALIPEPRATEGSTAHTTSQNTCIELVHHHLPQLNLIEVQWEARQLKDGTLHSLGHLHPLMRRTWRYMHANTG